MIDWQEHKDTTSYLINGISGKEIVIQIIGRTGEKPGWCPLFGFQEVDGMIKADSIDDAKRDSEKAYTEWCKSAGLREDNVCEWVPEEGESYWHTSCGDDFILVDGTPEENHIIYCHYCGGRVTIKESEAGK